MAGIQPTPPRHSGRSPFDSIRHVDENADGTEFEWWSARELMDRLGYDEWRNFQAAIERARTTCRNLGRSSDDNFRVVSTNNPGQNNRGRSGTDVQLTRFGCYLVAMNGDPAKFEIAQAQAYFAVQTYRAEQLLPPPVAPPVRTASVPVLRPWYERFNRTFMPHICDLHLKHEGCFSVVSATVNEMMHVEDQIVRHLMTTRGFDRPDVSIGKRWAVYRREDLVLPEVIRSALLRLPDQGIDAEVKVYEGKEWPEFQKWFRNCYLTEHLAYYLNHKKEFRPYPELTRYSTADNASRNLGGRPAALPTATRAALTAAGGFSPALPQLPE